MAGEDQALGNTFAVRLRQLRDQRGLTPSALAHEVGITEGAIRHMELGNTKSASFSIGLRLASVLGVTPYFLAGEPNPGSPSITPPADAPPGMTLVPTAALAEVMERIQDLESRTAALEPRHAEPPAPKAGAKSASRHK